MSLCSPRPPCPGIDLLDAILARDSIEAYARSPVWRVNGNHLTLGGGSAAVASHAVDGIRIREIRKRFRKVQALDGVSLHVDPGEVVALPARTGPEEHPDQDPRHHRPPGPGSATVGGHDVVRDAMGARRALGVAIGDQRSHYWRISGRRNLAFFGALVGLSPRGCDPCRAPPRGGRPADAADRPVLGYSSGMRARSPSLARFWRIRPCSYSMSPRATSIPLRRPVFEKRVAARRREGNRDPLRYSRPPRSGGDLDSHPRSRGGRTVLEEAAQGLDAVRLESAFLDAVQSHGGGEVLSDEMMVGA